mgnify:CR=1 FL=1
MYLEVKDLKKSYGEGGGYVQVLRGITAEVEKGEMCVIQGTSGSGKSTLLNCIGGLDTVDSGSIVVDGQEVAGLNSKALSNYRREKLGFIFQVPNLYPWLTIRENIMLPLKIHKLKGEQYEKKADDLLAYVGLQKYADSYPNEISGGMSQRIGVIRAMIHNPQILMMDEPFGALDEDTRETLNVELVKIWRDTGMTIIFITHNIEEAVLLSQRVYVMSSHPGQVKTELTIDFGEKERDLDLLSDPKFAQYCTQIEQLIGHLALDEIK